MSDDPPAERSEDIAIEAMMQWERWVAMVLGLILGGLGVWAVFKSSNQAGSAVLLLIGTAFLLIGVQGTPLIKIGGSTANLELERRRRAKEVTDLAQDETNPDVAQGMLEAAEIIEPKLTGLSWQLRSSIYEDRVGVALDRLFDEVERQRPPHRHDFIVRTPMGRTDINVKYKRAGSFRTADVAAIVRRNEGRTEKVVVVTNVPLAKDVRNINSAGTYNETPVEIVTWNDGGDDGILQRAIPRGANS